MDRAALVSSLAELIGKQGLVEDLLEELDRRGMTIPTTWSDEMRQLLREELQTSPMLDELLDAEQAAELLKMTKAAVLKAAQRGGLPAVRHGRRVRFRRRDLLDVTKKER
jgi:excisionase family DNA binding protein